jgi:hypothetical protein
MGIKAIMRGHEIELRGNCWYYVDNDLPVREDRECIKCGRNPTTEGFDACLGYVAGVESACCGHGKTEKIMVHS